MSELTTAVLGSVQFQDITRQMVGSVQSALTLIGQQHVMITEYLQGDPDATLGPDLDLATLSDGYVMLRQRRVHAAVVQDSEFQAPAMSALEIF